MEILLHDYPYQIYAKDKMRFYAPSNDIIISEYAKTSRYWEFNFITNLYLNATRNRKDFSFFDIGANIGTTSILASNFFSHIYAFEIDSLNCSLFEKNMLLNNISNYSLFQKAISDKYNAKIPIFLSQSNIGAHSLCSQDDTSLSNQTVHAITLDSFSRSEKITNCAFLHIDTQGHDLKVLQGAYDFIANQDSRPVIQLEFDPHLLKIHESPCSELVTFITTFNYKTFINANNSLGYISTNTLYYMYDNWLNNKLPSDWQFSQVPWLDLYLIPN
jgi:FkbM family methyltransferase